MSNNNGNDPSWNDWNYLNDQFVAGNSHQHLAEADIEAYLEKTADHNAEIETERHTPLPVQEFVRRDVSGDYDNVPEDDNEEEQCAEADRPAPQEPVPIADPEPHHLEHAPTSTPNITHANVHDIVLQAEQRSTNPGGSINTTWNHATLYEHVQHNMTVQADHLSTNPGSSIIELQTLPDPTIVTKPINKPSLSSLLASTKPKIVEPPAEPEPRPPSHNNDHPVSMMQKSETSTPDYSPSVLARRRRDNLHKRYQEAAKKSQAVFARLNATLSTTQTHSESPQSLTTVAAKRVPLILLPVAEVSTVDDTDSPKLAANSSFGLKQAPAKFFSPQLHDGEITFNSIAAESTPVSHDEKISAENMTTSTVLLKRNSTDTTTDEREEIKPVGILKYDERSSSNQKKDQNVDKGRLPEGNSRRGPKDRDLTRRGNEVIDSSDDRNRRANDTRRNRTTDANNHEKIASSDLERDRQRRGNKNDRNRNDRGSSEAEDSQSPDADDESYRRRRSNLIRSTSRASVYSAYDGYYDERERRQQRYTNTAVDDRRHRRPESRGTSEYGYDKRSTYSERNYNYSRPRSTRDFDDESDESLVDEHEDQYEYEYQNRRRDHHRGLQNRPSTRRPDPYAQMMATDPAWQKYLLEFYRHNGYYPTYEQLHRMWLEQQQQATFLSTSLAAIQASAKNATRTSLTESSSVAPRLDGTDVIARSRTEHYVATQQTRHVQDDEKASQLSVTISGLKEACHSKILDSDRSADMLGSNFSTTDTFGIQVPHKHSVPHAVARFGAGGHLVLVTHGAQSTALSAGAKAHRAATSVGVVELRSVRRLIRTGASKSCDEVLEATESFPGPLCASTSDKTALVEFCRRKVDACRKDVTGVDRQSATLLWQTIATLIRQNGIITGADLARLLLDGCSYDSGDQCVEVESDPVSIDQKYNGSSSHHIKNRSTKNSIDDTSDEFDKTLINSATQTIDRVEQHFRELLFVGCKKDALEWAIKHKLWGHALFLAMKIDQRTHTNVMIRFANSLPLTDPLQTLYQMMSGVSPSAVTRLSDDQWSDWRAHLAIMISNLSLFNGQPTDQRSLERELNAVLTLGDTLMSDGRPLAAHFCHLACHMLQRVDVFNCSSGHHRANRVTLIGAHCELKSSEIFNIERYHMTELYEYATGLAQFTLGNVQYYLPTLQDHKFTYALLLLEYGFAEQAYKYMTAIGAAILQQPILFNLMLKNLVIDLGERLYQFDTNNISFDGTSTMPDWISRLKSVKRVQEPNLAEQPLAAATSPVKTNPIPAKQRFSYDPTAHGFKPVATAAPPSEVATSPTRQKTFFIGTKAKEDNIVSQNNPAHHQANVQTSTEPQVNQWSNGPVDYYESPFTNTTAQNEMNDPNNVEQYYSDENVQQFDYQYNPMQNNYGTTTMNADNFVSDRRDRKDSYGRQSSLVDYGAEPGNYDRPIEPSISRNYTHEKSPRIPSGRPSNVSPDGANNGSLNDSVFMTTATPPSTQRPNSNLKPATGSSQQQRPDSKLDASKRNKSWLGEKLGGVVKKFLPKDPNEMILPDDRQKTILWDEKTGKWVNLTGESNDEPPPPPPPSMVPSTASMSATPTIDSNQQQFIQQQQVSSTYFMPQKPVITSIATDTSSVKPVNRLAGYGKRYATVNAFGVIPSQDTSNQSSAPVMPGGPGPFGAMLPPPVAASSPTMYFVPQPMANSNDGDGNGIVEQSAFSQANLAPPAEPSTAYAY